MQESQKASDKEFNYKVEVLTDHFPLLHLQLKAKHNKDFTAIRNNLLKEYGSDKAVISAAIAKSGTALKYAAEYFQDDKYIVMTAIKNNTYAFQYASERLRGNREVYELAATSEYGIDEIFKHASEELRSDSNIILKAMHHNIDILCNVPSVCLGNIDLAKRAVMVDGRALYHLSEALKNNVAIITLAVGQDIRALDYVSRKTKSNDYAELKKYITDLVYDIFSVPEETKAYIKLYQENFVEWELILAAATHLNISIPENYFDLRIKVLNDQYFIKRIMIQDYLSLRFIPKEREQFEDYLLIITLAVGQNITALDYVGIEVERNNYAKLKKYITDLVHDVFSVPAQVYSHIRSTFNTDLSSTISGYLGKRVRIGDEWRSVAAAANHFDIAIPTASNPYFELVTLTESGKNMTPSFKL